MLVQGSQLEKKEQKMNEKGFGTASELFPEKIAFVKIQHELEV